MAIIMVIEKYSILKKKIIVCHNCYCITFLNEKLNQIFNAQSLIMSTSEILTLFEFMKKLASGWNVKYI